MRAFIRKQIAVKLSEPSKMPCYTWSLQARETCPGSIEPKTKTLVDACRSCYAMEGNYRRANVLEARRFNAEDWKRAEWSSEMITALSEEQYFRWFDSGDCYSLALARKMLDVMRASPHCLFWLPSRMEKFAKVRAVYAEMRALPNVAVRFSSDSVTGEFTPGLHGSTIIPDASNPPPGVTVCGAYTRGGVCGDCRDCWNKKIDVIAYPAHGVAIRKVIKIALAA
jgi:hypothetical protein